MIKKNCKNVQLFYASEKKQSGVKHILCPHTIPITPIIPTPSNHPYTHTAPPHPLLCPQHPMNGDEICTSLSLTQLPIRDFTSINP